MSPSQFVFVSCLIASQAFARPQTAMGTEGGEEEEPYWMAAFDDWDADALLDNPYLVRAMVACLADEGPCSSGNQMVKDSLVPLMSTLCGRCNDEQTAVYKYTVNKFRRVYEKEFLKLLAIYDPKSEHWPKLKEFLES